MRYRILDTKDAKNIVDLFIKILEDEENYFLTDYEQFVGKNHKHYIDRIEQYIHLLNEPETVFIGAEDEDKLIGCIYCIPDINSKRSHVQKFTIYVHPDYQNQGIGKNLLRIAINFLKNTSSEILTCEVFESNERAIHLYQKFGFSVYGLLKNGIKIVKSNGEIVYDNLVFMKLNLNNNDVHFEF